MMKVGTCVFLFNDLFFACLSTHEIYLYIYTRQILHISTLFMDDSFFYFLSFYKTHSIPNRIQDQGFAIEKEFWLIRHGESKWVRSVFQKYCFWLSLPSNIFIYTSILHI